MPESQPVKTVKVVAAIIRRGDKIYATQRGYGDYKDGWEFPGGKVEPHETPEQALIREIKEELLADIKVGKKLITVEHDYPGFHLSMDCFWAELVNDEDPVLTEHEAARWLAKDALNEVDWLPADVKVVEAVLNSYTTFTH
ncbi:MAG: (deoxy)nucleoside triphosphate pyrophosphohydrolase [Clostridiales bacterium]|nr:(deoxy)nucleoside triphosphate pyrophosphohydrolase [Clostridiales bacterium]